ncbi:MAG TPA: SMI1/KNR4 family protein [Coleofasciculaceae cyanobacterium]
MYGFVDVPKVSLSILFMYLDRLKNLVKSLDGIESRDILACTEDEVNQLEQEMGLTFPKAYREFLLWCGKRLGKVVWDDRFYYPFQPEMKEEAIESLIFDQQDASFIDEHVIVIRTHEGCSYCFIRTDEEDDPPVYHFFSGRTVNLSYSHFSDYFYNEAIRYLKWYHGLAEQV